MFNNREIATVIWLALLAIAMLTRPNARACIARVFRAFLKWKILFCLAAMVLYTAILVASFYAFGFWQFTMIKDTTLWFFFVASPLVIRFVTPRDNPNILRQVVVDNLKLIVFLEFLIGAYVMSLLAELGFVLFVACLVIVDTVVRLDEKNTTGARITGALLAVIGVAILGFAVSRAIGDYRNLGTMDTVRRIAFPPLMSIPFVPFIYLVVIVATYDSIFLRLTFGRDKDPNVVRYAKRRILFHHGLSLRRLRDFRKRTPSELKQIESTEDVDRILGSA